MGLGFIKADDMFGFHSSEIAALGAAIKKSGCPIVLSLSPGTRDASKLDTWSEDAKPGNWPDLGLPNNCTIRDPWAKKDLGTVADGRELALQPHASGFFRVTPAK